MLKYLQIEQIETKWFFQTTCIKWVTQVYMKEKKGKQNLFCSDVLVAESRSTIWKRLCVP